MEIDSKKLQMVQGGRMSEILLAQLGEKIRAQKESALRKLIAAFKGGAKDAPSLCAGLAAYCALEDFESELSRESKQANRIAKEIYESAPGQPKS